MSLKIFRLIRNNIEEDYDNDLNLWLIRKQPTTVKVTLINNIITN